MQDRVIIACALVVHLSRWDGAPGRRNPIGVPKRYEGSVQATNSKDIKGRRDVRPELYQQLRTSTVKYLRVLGIKHSHLTASVVVGRCGCL